MKVIVFDLGGTLMEYVGMPYSWVDFYTEGLEAIIQKLHYPVLPEAVEQSLQMLKEFNPRQSGREVEYPADYIFDKVLAHWQVDAPISACIEAFWSGLQLKARVYPDTIPVLQELKEKGYAAAALTDLPSAMPDERFRRDISGLLPYLDYYVSSSVAGYRKPNSRGLELISERFAIPVPELIFVGDEEKDRETAARAGCSFIWIQRGEKKEGSICSLYELLKLFDEK